MRIEIELIRKIIIRAQSTTRGRSRVRTTPACFRNGRSQRYSTELARALGGKRAAKCTDRCALRAEDEDLAIGMKTAFGKARATESHCANRLWSTRAV